MATLDKGIITQAGLDLFNRVEAGKAQITYTKVVFSENTDILNMQDTDVRQLNDVQPQNLKATPQAFDNGEVTGENNIKASEVDIRCIADNKSVTKGFNPHVTALYATDGTKQILYGVMLRQNPGYLPSYDGFTPQPLMFTWRLFTATTDNFNLDTKGDVYATLADLNGITHQVEGIQEATDKLTQQVEAKVKALGDDLQKQVQGVVQKYSSNIDDLTKSVTMLKGNPPTAPGIQATMDTDKGVINYDITQPSNNGGSNIYQFKIIYKTVNELDYHEQDQAGNELHGTIPNINKKVKYQVYAIAVNAAGESPHSETVTVTPDNTDPTIMGVSWSRVANPALQRTDGAIGKFAGINGNRNDFDHMPIYEDMHRVTDGNGNVFVRIPSFYIYKSQTGSVNNGNVTIKISLTKHGDGWYLPKCFWDFSSGAKLPYVDIGAYNAHYNSNNHLESKAGEMPVNNSGNGNGDQGLNQLRTLAQNQDYQLLDIHMWDVLQTLFVVEFATLDCQSIMAGYSGDYESLNTGATDGLPGSSHYNSGANNDMCYRGIEDLWSHNWQYLDGVNINDGRIYVCDDARQYQTGVFTAPYHQVGYSLPTNNAGDTFITSIGLDLDNPEANFPDNIGQSGSNTSYYCDAFNIASGQQNVIVGGAANMGNGENGIFCMHICAALNGGDTIQTGRIAKKATFGGK